MLKLYVDGIEGREVARDAAWQYALGKVAHLEAVPTIYRRKVAEVGTYGGWRWECDPSHLAETLAASSLTHRQERST